MWSVLVSQMLYGLIFLIHYYKFYCRGNIFVSIHIDSLFGILFNYSPTLKKWDYTGFAMSFRDSVTAKLKCILLNNFYVCGPTSVKLILHLVSKVSKM